MPEKTMVSVCMITYNHEAFIKEAIEGVLMQKCDFPIELVIGEDCSTDNTRKICEDYASKFPEIIKLLPSNKNWGIIQNSDRTLQACQGKYIAICEGDDYWTAPLKLQKQVDFLEANQEYIICYHDSIIVDSNNRILHKSYAGKRKNDYSSKELKSVAFIITNTALFRNIPLPKYIGEDKISNGDIVLWSKLGNFGKGKFLDSVPPSAYRRHNTSWSATNQKKKIPTNVYSSYLVIFNNTRDNSALLKKLKELHTKLFASSLIHLNIEKIKFLNSSNYSNSIISKSELYYNVLKYIFNRVLRKSRL